MNINLFVCTKKQSSLFSIKMTALSEVETFFSLEHIFNDGIFSRNIFNSKLSQERSIEACHTTKPLEANKTVY